MWGDHLPANASIPTSGLGVFLILWTNHTDIKEQGNLRRCLQSLDVYFNDQHNYPVIIMHEDVPVSMQQEIATWTRSSVAFVGNALLDHAYLAAFNRTGYTVQPRYTTHTGYLHMIRTNIYRWPLHRALFGYRYVFKLDSDASFVEPVTTDVFRDMLARDAKAGYVRDINDNALFCVNLYETAEEIVRYNQLTPARDIYHVPKYWTWHAFAFVLDTSFARSPAYLNTVWHLNNVHGAFRWRWGDPQLTLLAHLFLTERQIVRLAVPLHHQAACVNLKNETSCKDVDAFDWSAGRKSGNSTHDDVHWRWRPNRGWSTRLWPIDPASQPPYCMPESLCAT